MHKNLLLLTIFLSTHTCLYSMDQALMPRIDHAQQEQELLQELSELNEAIYNEKLRQSKVLVSVNRKWDLKNAATPAVYTLLMGGKLAYSAYALYNIPAIPEWLAATSLGIDICVTSAQATLCALQLIRACCRKAKVE